VTNLLSIIDELIGNHVTTIWWELLRGILQDLRDEIDNALLPMSYYSECVYEALAEQRREQAVGSGVFMSTVQLCKRNWSSPTYLSLEEDGHKEINRQVQEEERRVYYVAMTRAKETLCLFERADMPNPHTGLVEGDYLLKRTPSFVAPLMIRYYAVGTTYLQWNRCSSTLQDASGQMILYMKSSLASGRAIPLLRCQRGISSNCTLKRESLLPNSLKQH